MLVQPSRSRLLAVGTAAVAIAVGAASAARAVTGDLVEMEVLGVIPLESESASLLVLRQKGARTMLPIFVGRAEGTDIDGRIKRGPAERGRGADLLRKSIEALGGKVSRVVIDSAQGALFSARVALQQGRNHLDVEARPSECVALAMASRAPIYATRNVMTEAGLTEQDLARTHGGKTGSSAREEAVAKPGKVESF